MPPGRPTSSGHWLQQRQRRRWRRRHGRREAGWTGASAALLLAVAALLLAAWGGAALVVEHPCCANELHVPAAFGPDLLTHGALVGKPLVVVDPPEACSALKPGLDLRGQVALVRRGTCNFTDKVLRAQAAGAAAVVVYDSQERERWGTIMAGQEDRAALVSIPAVFVAHATGMALRDAALRYPEGGGGGMGGGKGGGNGGVRVTLNDTGHVRPRAKQIGPVETLATYVVVSLVLLSFSGCCGLLLALGVTCYQRAFRQRAMRGLKLQVYRTNTNKDKDKDKGKGGGTKKGGGGSGGGGGSAGGKQKQKLKQRGSAPVKATKAEEEALGVQQHSVGGGAQAQAQAIPTAERGGASSSSSSRPAATAAASTTTTGGAWAASLSRAWPPRLFASLRRRSGGDRGGGSVGAKGAAAKGGATGPTPPPSEAAATASLSSSPAMPPRSPSHGSEAEGEAEPELESESESEGDSEEEEEEAEEEALCPICLECYEDGDRLRVLPCGHAYHDACIKPWLMEKSEACPKCRRPAFHPPLAGQGTGNGTGAPAAGRGGPMRAGAAGAGAEDGPVWRLLRAAVAGALSALAGGHGNGNGNGDQEPGAGARGGGGGGGGYMALPPLQQLDAAAVDELCLWLLSNMSGIAMVLVAVVTSAFLLGAVALLTPRD